MTQPPRQDYLSIINNRASLGVLGASGFIGTGIMRYAENSGMNIKGISRRAPEYAAESIPKLNILNGDINDRDILVNFCKSVDVVIDCASSLKPSSPKDNEFLEEAILLDKRIQAAATAGASKYIYISSGGALYSESQKAASETSSLRPSSKYGLGKQLCEAIVEFHSNKKTIPVISARTSNPYGPYHKSATHGFINIFIRNMLSDKCTTIYGDPSKIEKDYIYIDDCSKSLLLIAMADTHGHSAINVGHGLTNSLHDIISTVSARLNMQPLVKYTDALNYDKQRFHLDIKLLNSLTGFRPTYDLEKGIQETIEWEKQMRQI